MKSPTTLQSETEAAVAPIAARSRTSAVASLSRLSPSRTAITRPETPRRLTIVVATASVGLTIAPSAIPQARLSPGMAQEKKTPSSSAVITTSTTERPRIAVNSRRKSIEGIETAAEYSSGGRTTVRIHSGSISTSGTNGSRLTAMPTTTSSNGAAIPTRGPKAVAPAIASSPRTTTISESTISSVEQERPPVLHRSPVVVKRGVVQPGHVLAPVDDPAAHAVGRELAVGLEHGGRPWERLLLWLAPGLDRREHRAGAVEVIVRPSVGHEVHVAACRHIVLHAMLAPAGPVAQRRGGGVGDGIRPLRVERLERQPEAAVEVEHRVLAEVALVVRQRAARRHPLQRVTQALHRAADSAREVDEQRAQAAADPRCAVSTGVPGLVLEADRPEVLVVGPLDLDGLPRRAALRVIGE